MEGLLRNTAFRLQLDLDSVDENGKAIRGVLLATNIRIADMLPYPVPAPGAHIEPVTLPVEDPESTALPDVENELDPAVPPSAEEAVLEPETEGREVNKSTTYPIVEVPTTVEPFADVLLPAVVPQLAKLLLDIGYLVIFCLLFLSPHRLLQCLGTWLVHLWVVQVIHQPLGFSLQHCSSPKTPRARRATRAPSH